jgi:methylated-DNA-[protein]-cysteine S-methyltransferase
MKNFFGVIDSPIGELYVVVADDHIVSLHIGKESFEKEEEHLNLVYQQENPTVKVAIQQLDEYFSGFRKNFDLPLLQKGTLFQQKVWNELHTIPYGETRSYGDIAELINSPKAVRAIGQANRKNSIPIIVPCHRVIGKNSSLTGYAGKRTDIKQKLLDLEGASYKS